MRKVILAVVVVLLFGIAVAASTTYTLSPWPYGVAAWVQTKPNDVVLQKVEKAVQDVFSFWHQPLPQSAENWHELSEMQEDTWTESKYDPFTAGFVPIPSPTASPMWAIPLPTWKGEEILPLTLLIASNRSLVQSLAGSTAGAAFSARNMPNSVLSLNRDPSLGVLATRSDSVVLNYNSPDLRHDLEHELSHWLTNLICQRHDLTLQDVPHLLGEGFAEYTACKLGRDTRWRNIAAVWAEDDHGLSDVPMFMWYPIGTSLVSFLVERDGVDAFSEKFPNLVTDWDQIIPNMTPAWQAWASNYEVDEAQHAYAEATIEQLSLCGMVLQPILPEEAFSIFDRVYSLAGSTEDIERFWELISAPIPKPSNDAWKELQQQTHTIVEVARSYSDPEPFNAATENEYQLSRLWAKGDWEGYHALFIKTLRDVVAHYGTVQKVGAEAEESKDEGLCILDRVCSLAGSMEDIERFCELISAPIPKPGADVWKQLQKDVHTIVEAARSYSDPGIAKAAAENEYQLSRLWAKGDWEGYHALFIKTLCDVIAHYGTVQKVGAEAEESK